MQPALMPPTPAAIESDVDRARRIRDTIRQRSVELRERYPILSRRQSEIGLILLLLACAVMVGGAVLYAVGTLPAWATVMLIALACSIAHEIEHDLIHKLYFPRHRRVVDAMLALGWLMRPSTIKPWTRRDLHLNHHRISGTLPDIEERAITNGERMGARRLLMMIDPLASVMLRKVPAGMRPAILKWTARACWPLGFFYFGAWYTFLAVHGAGLVAAAVGLPFTLPAVVQPAMAVIDFLAVVLMAPNLLRTFSLHFISSNLHYFGDVEDDNVVQQTQVLNRWYLLPLQLFCFNFGSTHGIHHFYVPDPFYLRQMTAPVAHAAMRANGVRFNDMGTLWRANRYAAA
jgi:fatty acid desaturase